MTLKTLLSYLSEVVANISDAKKSLERAVKLFEKIINGVPDVVRDYVDDVERLEIERKLIEAWEKVKIASSLISDASSLIFWEERDLEEILDRSESMQKSVENLKKSRED